MIDLDKLQATLERELDSLRRTRDELRVQLNLAKADARSEWDRLETRLQATQDEVSRVSARAKEALQEIERDSRKLLDELKAGYARIRQQL